MATNDEIPGLGPKTDRPRLNTSLDLASIKLTPTEGFVLSRIDGRASYDEVCRISSLGREQTLGILRRLKSEYVILGPGDKILPPHKNLRPTKTPSPDRSHKMPPPDRGHKTPAPIMVTEEMLRKAHEKKSGKPQEKAEAQSLLDRLDDGQPVEPADLIEGHDLSAETKRRMIRLYRRLRKLPAHELLGVAENADEAAVKRAFAAASKELHPDRYYGKDLGHFREKLAKIFARLTEAVQEMEKARKSKK